MTHLEYDLLVANVLSAPVTLTALEVLASDAPVSPALLRVEGAALGALTQSVSGGGGPSTADVRPRRRPRRHRHRSGRAARRGAGAVALDALVAALTDPGVDPAMNVAGPNGHQTGTYPLLLAVADFR
jgi:hypothetical protein